MKSVFRKLRWLARRSGKEAELKEELRFHLEEEAQRRQAAGLPEDEAGWAARRDLGNLTLVQERTRTAWGWEWLEQFGNDAAYGLRQLRMSPVFSVVAIATLALGIGGMTAMFSAFDTILLRPLPYADADRLVVIWDDLGAQNLPKHFPTPFEWMEWRRLNTVFIDVAATQPAAATLSGDAAPEQVPARRATSNLWSVLGVKPLLGRVFTAEEDEKGVRVAMLSHGLWQRRYGGSPDIVGRKITVNDNPYEVVGVLPREFYFLPARDIDVWTPAAFPAWMRRPSLWHDEQVVARLKPGVTSARARESMSALSRQLTAKNSGGPHPVFVTPLREEIAGKTQDAVAVLLCASGALLLIACVNLANLLMARGTVRGREVAVRAALGAGRGRLLAQFLTENAVLAGLGTAAGLLLAVPAMRFLEAIVPETMGAARLTLDWRILAFSAAAGIAAVLVFGLAPALRGSRLAPLDGLRDGGRGTAGERSHWFQHSLIVVETSLAVVLLTSGGLLLQTFQHLRSTELGLRSEQLLTLESPLFRYKDFDRRVAFVNAMLEKIRALPGVINAGASSQIPLKMMDGQATFYRFEDQSLDRLSGQVALMRVVTRDYFATIGASLREGRFFDIADRRGESPVAIVNETFARRNFPGRSALGARFKYGQLNDKGYWYTIAGVVKEVREVGMMEELRPVVYRLHDQTDQAGSSPGSVAVRTAVPPESIVPALRQAIWSVDPNQPIWRVEKLQAIVDRQLSTPTQSTALLGAFALLALLLASLGLYGVLSYTVTRRIAEIGIRMALGATSGEILLSFGKRGLALTLAGLAIGLVLAAIAAHSLTSLLYGFRPDYIPTAAFVSLILLAVAALACFVPARRASRIDPMIALRNE